MMTKQATLKIELRSDLCSGSGLSYAGIIDSDVVYDEYGFPFIPARRMKGCLREAAEIIAVEEEIINSLFGTRGDNAPGCLQIGNAVLERAEGLEKEIGSLKQDDVFKELLVPENILGMYTSVRAQTRIDCDTGSADDKTLRFTRVVNQYDPFGATNSAPQHLCFLADVRWQAPSEEAEKMKKYLEQIAKATRNIGINRNRGLGSIRCDLIDVNDTEESEQSVQDNLICTEDCGNDMVKLSYVLENTAPLILSDDDESETSSYINGKSILGALAGAYLHVESAKGIKDRANTQEFQDLFLNGTVQYANAYPVAGNLRASPAPLYLNKLKKTKSYINKLLPDPKKKRDENDSYNTTNGNQPKLLKTEYVAEGFDGNGKLSYQITEPEKEIAYHHRHCHGEDEKKTEEQLYTLEYLKREQQFAGVIYAPKTYAKCLCRLLTTSKLCFGKSRSAQYGTCKIAPYFLECKPDDKAQYCKDEEIVVILKSDAVFMDKKGCYTVCFTEVKDLLADALGIKYDSLYSDEKSIIQTKEVVGYNTTWNMKREAVPAVSSGSAFVYKLSADIDESHEWPVFIGERIQEGFGEIEICPLSQMKYEVKDGSEPGSDENADVSQGACATEDQNVLKSASDVPTEISNDMVMIICKLLREPLIEQLMGCELGVFHRLKSTNIGRLILMLKESVDASGTPDGAANDFWARIRSIKSDYGKDAQKLAEKTTTEIQKKNVENAHEKYVSSEKDEDGEKKQYEIDSEKMFNLVGNGTIKNALNKLPVDSKDNLLKDVWREYMLQYLIQLEYECKEGEIG